MNIATDSFELHIVISSESLHLIEAAAKLKGQSVEEFIMESAIKKANELAI